MGYSENVNQIVQKMAKHEGLIWWIAGGFILPFVAVFLSHIVQSLMLAGIISAPEGVASTVTERSGFWLWFIYSHELTFMSVILCFSSMGTLCQKKNHKGYTVTMIFLVVLSLVCASTYGIFSVLSYGSYVTNVIPYWVINLTLLVAVAFFGSVPFFLE